MNIYLYRGAKSGIDVHSAGSFFTAHEDVAISYADQEEDGIVYEFSLKNLNLIDILDTEDGSPDEGILRMTDEELMNYDGYYVHNSGNKYVQVCLFGRVSKDGFQKLSVEDIKADAKADHRRYDR
jgi:hypothetical protein